MCLPRVSVEFCSSLMRIYIIFFVVPVGLWLFHSQGMWGRFNSEAFSFKFNGQLGIREDYEALRFYFLLCFSEV